MKIQSEFEKYVNRLAEQYLQPIKTILIDIQLYKSKQTYIKMESILVVFISPVSRLILKNSMFKSSFNIPVTI